MGTSAGYRCFANTSGGTVLVGIDDKGNVVGVRNADETMQRIVGLSSNSCKPPIRPQLGKMFVEGKEIIWVKIPKQCDALRMVSGKCYIRSGPTALPVEDRAELKRLLPRRAAWVCSSRQWLAFIALIIVVASIWYLVRFTKHGVPSKATRLYQLALQYEANGDDEQAITALDQTTSIDPHFTEAYLEAALICDQIDWEDRAKKYLQAAEQSSPHVAEELKLKMAALKDKLNGDGNRALQKYQGLVDAYPTDTAAQYYLADLALELDRPDDARRAVEACLRQEPLNPYCNFEDMMVQVYSNKFEDVLRSYDSLRAKHLYYPWFDEPVGLALFGQDEFDKAAAQFKTLTSRRNTLHGLTHFLAGKEYLSDIDCYQGKVHKAQETIEKILAAEQPKERAGVLVDLAEMQALVDNANEARSLLRRASSAWQDPFTAIDAATVFAILGDRKKVEATLSQKLPKGEPVDEIGGSTKHLIEGLLALAGGQSKQSNSRIGRVIRAR